eukprot:2510280-Amphidinium_carterae.1
MSEAVKHDQSTATIANVISHTAYVKKKEVPRLTAFGEEVVNHLFSHVRGDHTTIKFSHTRSCN